MKIVIAGAGRVGYSIAHELSKGNHEITLIDCDGDRVRKVSNNLDVMVYEGNAASYEMLKEAGIKGADLLIAVTKSDETNLLCCLCANKIGAKHTIARVRSRDYIKQANFLKEELGLSMIINPEEETASEISRILRFPSASKVESFANSRAESVEIKISENSSLNGMGLSELRSKSGANVLACAVFRGDDAFIPRGDYVMRAGDRINFIGAYSQINLLAKRMGFNRHTAKNVLAVGGGNVALYLAHQVYNTGINLKIIENDKEACAKIKYAFPKVSVVHGDGNDPELLKEEGISDANAFVAITDDDDDNVITSMFAISSNCKKVITQVHESHIIKLLSNNALDSMIQPSDIATQRIVSYVRSMQNAYNSSAAVESLYYIFDRNIEILELKVSENFKYDSVPLKSLKISHDAIVASIIHNGSCIIPSGDNVIHSGDSVIIATSLKGVLKLEDVVEGK